MDKNMTTDKYAGDLRVIDEQERAGILSHDEAEAMRKKYKQAAAKLAGRVMSDARRFGRYASTPQNSAGHDAIRGAIEKVNSAERAGVITHADADAIREELNAKDSELTRLQNGKPTDPEDVSASREVIHEFFKGEASHNV